jgi:hypothetical protein
MISRFDNFPFLCGKDQIYYLWSFFIKAIKLIRIDINPDHFAVFKKLTRYSKSQIEGPQFWIAELILWCRRLPYAKAAVKKEARWLNCRC